MGLEVCQTKTKLRSERESDGGWVTDNPSHSLKALTFPTILISPSQSSAIINPSP